MTMFLILCAVFLGMQVGMLAAVRPRQRRIRSIVATLEGLALTEDERAWVRRSVDSAFSWRSSILHCVALTYCLILSGETLDRIVAEAAPRNANLRKSDHYHELINLTFSSSAAYNPPFGLLAIILRETFRVKARIHFDSKDVDPRKLREIIDFASGPSAVPA